MPRIHFIDCEGTQRTVEAVVGDTLMETAVKNSIPGIEAECGGACSCATCHVYVEQSFLRIIGDANEIERSMLELAEDIRENSRLACQVKIIEELDGLRLETPRTQ